MGPVGDFLDWFTSKRIPVQLFCFLYRTINIDLGCIVKKNNPADAKKPLGFCQTKSYKKQKVRFWRGKGSEK